MEKAKKFMRGDKNDTFKKKHAKDSKRYELHKYAKNTLGSGNLQEAVRLPKGEDINEWLATNTIDFYNKISLLYAKFMEFCSPDSCPIMCAGPKYEYLWADSENKNKPIKIPANEYIENLLNWVQSFFDDESVFPSTVDQLFPKNFREILKPIYKRLFRVFAHVYYNHFEKMINLGEEAFLNSSFKHFYYFIDEFKLVDAKELAPLQDVIDNLTQKDKDRAANQ